MMHLRAIAQSEVSLVHDCDLKHIFLVLYLFQPEAQLNIKCITHYHEMYKHDIMKNNNHISSMDTGHSYSSPALLYFLYDT